MWWRTKSAQIVQSSLPDQLNQIAHAFDKLADEFKMLDVTSLAPRERKELAETLRQLRETISKSKQAAGKGG